MRVVIRGLSSDAPDKDHLLFELALVVVLGNNFPVEVEELLEMLILRWERVLDDGHQQLRLRGGERVNQRQSWN
jgi:hypothetical protein